MKLSMIEAQISPDDIDYLNTHSTSTPLGDVAEGLAVHDALGPRGRSIPVSGTKGYYGHPLGASGAIEAAICILVLQRDWLPPSVNLLTPDPRIDLNFVTGNGLDRSVDTVMSNSLGFGGINTCMVFRRC
jgi:3-oxoacyl-[acyl-carrier-protein] synthase II